MYNTTSIYILCCGTHWSIEDDDDGDDDTNLRWYCGIKWAITFLFEVPSNNSKDAA